MRNPMAMIFLIVNADADFIVKCRQSRGLKESACACLCFRLLCIAINFLEQKSTPLNHCVSAYIHLCQPKKRKSLSVQSRSSIVTVSVSCVIVADLNRRPVPICMLVADVADAFVYGEGEGGPLLMTYERFR